MTVGLPGSGLGGVFYLLCALWMPVHQLIRSLRGASGRPPLRLIMRQAGTAALMVGALVATGRALGWLLHWRQTLVQGGAGGAAAVEPELLRTAVLLLTVGALGVLLLGVEVISLALRRRAAGGTAAPPQLGGPVAPGQYAA